ncbi:MAG TPA: histidine kinase [Phnomibacter sp.]|nr:histidine kinase [Phnomibacter sp.]
MFTKKHTIIQTHIKLISLGLLLGILTYGLFFYINVGSTAPFPNIQYYLKDSWLILVQSVIHIYLQHVIIGFFNKRFASKPNSFTRFITEGLVVLLAGFLLQEVFIRLFLYFTAVPNIDQQYLSKKMRQVQMVYLVLLASLYGLLSSFRIFRILQQKQVELLRMQKEVAQSQFEALKNQLNPHFLFNSLSTLSSLVHINGETAETFVVKLSKTYRYILEQKDKETVPLQDELDFLQNYLFLLEQRFGPKLKVTLNQSPQPGKTVTLPPHSLMIVMEHIINSNAMSARQPLEINIEVQHQHVTITHTLQPKPPPNTGIEEQFIRLRQQYQYLMGPSRKWVQEQHQQQALIQLPLMAKAA